MAPISWRSRRFLRRFPCFFAVLLPLAACGSNDTYLGPASGECRADLDCDANHPFCHAERSHCVECRSNLDCPGGTCTGGGDCEIPCHSDAECGDKKPACNLGTGKCIECLANAYCPVDKPSCNLAEGKCQ